MSIQVPLSSFDRSPTKKKGKSHKRKHRDVSNSAINVEFSQSPTKKAKHAELVSLELSISQSPTREDSRGKSLGTSEPPFHLKTLSLYLSVSPVTLQRPVEGLCAEHLSPLLLTYYAPLGGVVLSYSNPKLSESPENPSAPGSKTRPTLALSIAEYGVSYVWLSADFLVLAPPVGSQIEGFVNVHSEKHLGLVCWNLFNATIASTRLPQGWEWKGSSTSARKDKTNGRSQEDPGGDMEMRDATSVDHEINQSSGHWTDERGRKVEGHLAFNVVMLDAESGNDQEGNYVSITGTMLDPEGEAKVLKQQKDDWERRHARKATPGRTKTRPAISGTSGATEAEAPKGDPGATSGAARKHRMSYK